MKKIFLAAALLFAACFCLSAEDSDSVVKDGVTYSNEDPIFIASGRFSVGADFKLARGLHATVAEELRLRYKEGAPTQGLDRLYTSLGLNYKVCPYVKLGLGFDFINVWKVKNIYADEAKTVVSFTEKYNEMRHRVSFDVTGMYKFHGWQFSLRERLQMTHYTDPYFDSFEEVRNALALRSRLKVSYSAKRVPLKPYVAAELRNTLNSVNLSKSSFDRIRKNGGDRLVMLEPSYSDAYVDRIRAEIGTEWTINARNTLDFYIIYDYGFKKEIKVSNEKRYLTALTGCPSNTLALGIAYTFGM